MITIYCAKKHRSQELCKECQELVEYSQERLSNCQFGNDKGSCKKCPIHCYKPEMRKRIRQVMRFSGPRLLLYRPIETIKHIF